jgi:protein ImuB
MTRTACVWCPDWPVIAARRRDDALRNAPIVVRERIGSRDVVRACDATARAAGVRRGMRRREAEARCPEAVCLDVDEPNEARTFESVARAIEVFTPRVVLERPGRCEFPTRGPSRYFGGDEPLASRVREAVAEVLGPDGADVRLGIADGAFTAWCAARRGVLVPKGESAAFLAPWPVTTFDDDVFADLLVRLGIRTLGDLAALPSDAVLARFGIEGRRFHDLARGIDHQPPGLVAPPPDLIEQIELDPPAERVDQVAFAAKGLADRLLARLDERGLACTRVLIEAETEHGERLTRCWRSDGTLTPAALAERVRWQLDGWITTGETTAGIAVLRLVPEEVATAHGRQLGFWGGDQAAHDRADRALARVQGMLGYDAVTTAVVQGGRTPREQVRWIPWGELCEPLLPLDAAWPGALPSPHPARVFDPPLPAEVVDARGNAVRVSGRGEQADAPAYIRCAGLPDGGGPVRAWAGPWAHDVRWWDRQMHQRCARWQVVIGEVACVVVVEAGRGGIEAIYD